MGDSKSSMEVWACVLRQSLFPPTLRTFNSGAFSYVCVCVCVQSSGGRCDGAGVRDDCRGVLQRWRDLHHCPNHHGEEWTGAEGLVRSLVASGPGTQPPRYHRPPPAPKSLQCVKWHVGKLYLDLCRPTSVGTTPALPSFWCVNSPARYTLSVGKGEAIETTLAALQVVPEPFRSFANTLVDICAYAGQCSSAFLQPFQSSFSNYAGSRHLLSGRSHFWLLGRLLLK